MLQRMRRIQVIGPRQELSQVVDILFNAGTVHLENASEMVPSTELCLEPVRLDAARSVAGALGRIQAIFATLPPIADDKARQDAIAEELKKTSMEYF